MKVFLGRIIFVFSFLLFIYTAKTQTISINEFMSSNATTIADEDGDYPDWIELHNYGDNDLNLLGWGISDDFNNPFKWILPNTIIEAGGFLLIWASGKDRLENTLHTNFSINSQGEELTLTEPSGIRIDEILPVELPTDISYCRYPDGTGNFKYYDIPTPKLPNSEYGFDEILSSPLFSHASGYFTDSFYLKISHPYTDAEIRYTLDGSVPTLDSGIFPDSLLIYNRKHDQDEISAIPTTPLTAPEWYRWMPPMDIVYKGTNIRVKGFREGTLSPFTETRTYWVDPEIHSRYSLPLISLSINEDDLIGPMGIFTYYNRTGPEWERDMHISFFEPNGQPGFATDAGVRVHGGNSRRYALKSFRVYFRNEYGDSNIDYPVFPDQEMNIHDRLVLRNGGSDWAYTYFRDPFVQSLLDGFTDVENQAYRPAVVFLNGEYWGIMNTRERFDDNYIENHYGYKDIDMLENTGQINYGSNAHYLNLISFLQKNNLNEGKNYEWVQTQMDVENFRDYHILQIFSMNTDQPGKNVRFWRPQTPEGKWRWMWWDMDDAFHFGPHNKHERNGLVFCTGLNTIGSSHVNSATPPPSWAPNGPTQTFPLRALLYTDIFRHDFINRFADLLNTAFQPNYLHSIIDKFHETVGPYMYEHYRRWHRPEPEIYHDHVQRLYDFAENRTQYVRQHMVDFFELDGSYNLNLDIASGRGHIRVNTLHLNEELPSFTQPVYPWTGQYFKGIAIEAEAIPAPGYVFSHWQGNIFSENPVIAIDSENDFELIAHFKEEEPTQREIISFWYFNNDLPNDTPLETVKPWYSKWEEETLLTFHSSIDGYPFHSDHQFWRKASMERRNQPTPLNYPSGIDPFTEYNPEEMRGIQIKQPFIKENGENNLVFNIPTTEYENIILSFAAIDEGAAQSLAVEYTTDHNQNNWISFNAPESSLYLEKDYRLIQVDFSSLTETANNPMFKVRLWFDGNNMHADEGNSVTFNNISLEGNPKNQYAENPQDHERELLVYPNPVRGDNILLPDFMNVQLFDIHGRILLQMEDINIIPITNLSAGVYFLQNDEGQWAKVVVQR